MLTTAEIAKLPPLTKAVIERLVPLQTAAHAYAVKLAAERRGMVVTDQGAKQLALELIAQCKEQIEEVEKVTEPLKRQLNDAKASLLQVERELVGPLKDAVDGAKRQLGSYQEQQERERQRQIAEQRDAALKAADNSDGPPLDPEAVAQPKEDLSGAGVRVTVRTLKRARVTDLDAFLTWWLSALNRPVDLIKVDESALAKLRPAYPNGLPGVEFYDKKSEAVS